MILADNEIYVIGKGFINPADICVNDRVYSLDGLKVQETTIKSITSEYYSGTINCINSGQHNVDSTPDALHLYHSYTHGSRYVSWRDIPKVTPNKVTDPNKYVPVLSYPDVQGFRNHDDGVLESVARMLALGRQAYDLDKFNKVVHNCTGEDAIVLIDFMEFWLSTSPGRGWFDRAHVKARSHIIYDKYFLDELCKITLLAGYTCTTTKFFHEYGLKVSYECMPVPGSIPKDQKYSQRYHLGLVYNIIAGDNLPIMGRSKNRCMYLPAKSTLN